jgi:excisionase family DNA binding protein
MNNDSHGPRAGSGASRGPGPLLLEDRLLSPADIALRTGLHVEVVRRAIRRGELRAMKLRGQLRSTSKDYEAWLESCRLAPRR